MIAHVSAVAEVVTSATVEQAPDLVVSQHGNRLLRDDRRAHLGHGGAVDLAFVVQPAEELL